ncbi:MAG: hypothetical protein JOZ92_02980 [Candidatus Dormibacteraeota bacterium]|nr:hypothetical protein [Candidatus Dormibacteraeota bacterium]
MKPPHERRRADERRRDHVLGVLRDTVSAFTVDVARLMAGHQPDLLRTTSPEVAELLTRSTNALVASTARVSPDFGQFAELRVEGDLLNDPSVRCVVRLQDRSELIGADGSRLRRFHRTVVLDVRVALQAMRVCDLTCSLEG